MRHDIWSRLQERTGRRLIAAACARDQEGFLRAWSTWSRLWEIDLLLNYGRDAMPLSSPSLLGAEGDLSHESVVLAARSRGVGGADDGPVGASEVGRP